MTGFDLHPDQVNFIMEPAELPIKYIHDGDIRLVGRGHGTVWRYWCRRGGRWWVVLQTVVMN